MSLLRLPVQRQVVGLGGSIHPLRWLAYHPIPGACVETNDRLASAIASLDAMKSALVAIREGTASADLDELARLRGLLRTRVAQAIDGLKVADESRSG